MIGRLPGYNASCCADLSSQRRELLQTAGCDVFISTTTAAQSVELAVEAGVQAPSTLFACLVNVLLLLLRSAVRALQAESNA